MTDKKHKLDGLLLDLMGFVSGSLQCSCGEKISCKTCDRFEKNTDGIFCRITIANIQYNISIFSQESHCNCYMPKSKSKE